MSTLSTTASYPQRAPMRRFAAYTDLLLPAYSLWLREIIRFYRMRSRVVGVIISPVLFWLVLGSGFGSSLRSSGNGGQHYLEYFFPGALIMIVLFTSIFAMMSLIEDRREGFLLSVLVSPASRSAIVLGKVLGGATLAFLQGLIFLVFAPLIGVRMGLAQIGISVLAIFLISFSLTALGFTIAWRLDSTQAFHAIINLFLIPLWLLSGALFPISGASGWIRALVLANPLTYGVEALRTALFATGDATSTGLSVPLSLVILAAFSLLMFVAALLMASRRRTLPA
ncbi:MAG TPA: ABC transporter permease [Terriglobales bacterium]|nr:ABC transporter permease [Terriglobales bacterium]